MKCKDCGNSEYEPLENNRGDISPECMALRMQLVPALQAGKITMPAFQALQKTIANSHGSGRGARAMKAALGVPNAAPTPVPSESLPSAKGGGK